MATRKLEQSDLAIRARESGHRIAHDQNQLSEQKASRAQQQSQFDESVNQQELSRAQAAWNQRRQERLQRDTARPQGRDGSIFGGQNVTNFNQPEQQPEDPAITLKRQQLDMQQQQIDQQGQQFQQGLELEAAKSGLMPAGGQQPGRRDQGDVAMALQQNPEDPRLQRMMREMQQGRQQMGLGVESTGGQKYVATPEGVDKAKTARMNAETAQIHAAVAAQKLEGKMQTTFAAMSGATGAQLAVEQAKWNALKKDAIKPLHASVNMQKAMSKGEGTDKQWSELQARADRVQAKGVAGDFQRIASEISARQYGPALRSFLAERATVDYIRFVTSAIGEQPEGFVFDPSTEAFKTFQANAVIAANQLRTPINAALYQVQDSEMWKRQVNMHAGRMTLEQLDPNLSQSNPEINPNARQQQPQGMPQPGDAAGGQMGRSGQMMTPDGKRQQNTGPKVGKEPMGQRREPDYSGWSNLTPGNTDRMGR